MIDYFRKKQKGSLTLEATLVLPIVIITLLFTLNILNICMVHVCMQQALNNAAKKISQDSYLVYKIAGEENHKKFINGLGEINEGYDEVEEAATVTKKNFDNLENGIKDTINYFNIASHSFDNGSLFDKLAYFGTNIKNLIESYKTTHNEFCKFKMSLDKLTYETKENISSVVIKLLLDTTTGSVGASIVEKLFSKYITDLSVPASKISDLSAFHSSLKEGSFTLVVDYIYNNPFSFMNKESLEYSIINKKIRMRNIIIIKPFIGKNDTSLIQTETSEG